MGGGKMEVQSRRLRDAAARGALDVCLHARNAGGAVTFVPQDAPEGNSTLHVAAAGDHGEVVAWLCREGANVDLLDHLGRTALHHSAADGAISAVEALVKSGIDLDTTDSVEKWTALHYAATYGKTACVQLLCAGGANANLKDAFGRTPLYLASQRGHTQAVATLVAAGADVESQANDGCTAFDFPRTESIVANLNEGLERRVHELTSTPAS